MTPHRFLATVVLLALAASLLGGCWSRREPESLAAVTMAALDRSEGNRFLWTVEVPRPAAAAAPAVRGESGGQQGPVRVVQGAGVDPTAAEVSLTEEISRQIFWGHANIFLLGEEAARHGLVQFLDFITRRYETRRQAILFVVRGEAAPIVLSGEGAERPGYVRLRDLIRQTRKQSVPVVDANTFLRHTHDPGLDPFLPLLEAPPPESQALARFAGLAVFREDRLAALFNRDEAMGTLWLRGEAPATILQIGCPDAGDPARETAALQLNRSLSELRAAITERGLDVTAVVEVGGQVLAWSCSRRLDAVALRRLQERAALHLRSQVEAALARMRRDGVDPAGFGILIYRRTPEVWEQVSDLWPQVLSTLSVSLQVRVEIVESGLNTQGPNTRGLHTEGPATPGGAGPP